MAAAAIPTPPPLAEAGAAVAPAAPAAPSPQYTPPPAPAPATPMAEGGATSGGGGGIKAFFSDINVLDVTISAFIVAAVLYSIKYHRYMMMLEKTGYADLSTRVQKLESAMAAAKRKAEANAAGNSKMVKKRGLVTL